MDGRAGIAASRSPLLLVGVLVVVSLVSLAGPGDPPQDEPGSTTQSMMFDDQSERQHASKEEDGGDDTGNGTGNATDLADSIPPVRWNVSFDAGPISTAPLVTLQGVIVVKVGGVPASGIPGGLRAFIAVNGTPLWSADHVGSTSGFEIAPLLATGGYQHDGCSSPSGLVITGWTDGAITAHHLMSGEVAWTVQTEKVSWGVTSAGVIDSELWLLAETEVLNICEVNGTVLDRIPLSHDGVQQTVYRAGIGNSGLRSHSAVATENATLQIIDRGGGVVMSSTDLTDIANLSGDWKVRSRPVWWQYYQTNGSLGHLMVQMTNDSDGRVLALNVSESGEVILWQSEETTSTSVLTPPSRSYGYFLITVEEEIAYGWGVGAEGLEKHWLVDVGGTVTGEVTWTSGLYCFPVNEAAGWWTVWDSRTNLSIHVEPDRTGWLTAGCGSSGYGGAPYDLYAFGNDASWLEARFNDHAAIRFEALYNLSSARPGEHEIPVSVSPGESEATAASAAEAAATAERNGALFGIVVTAAGATFVLWRIAGRRRLQVLSALWLVALLVALPALDATVDEYAADLVQSEGDAHDGLPTVWHDSQVVCFLHSPDIAPAAYADGVHHVAATGAAVRFEAAANDSDERGVCIGGIRDADTVARATERAAEVAGLELQYEGYVFGDLLVRVGEVDAGDGERHWLFWLDGAYGTAAVDRTDIDSDAVIVWRYMTEVDALALENP